MRTSCVLKPLSYFLRSRVFSRASSNAFTSAMIVTARSFASDSSESYCVAPFIVLMIGKRTGM